MAQKTTYPDQEAPPQQQGAQGFWPWFLQRVTGVALIALLGVHIWVNHFAGLEEVTSGRQEELVLFSLVKERLKTALFIAIDFSMLALVLYHGLNGIRSILLDLGLRSRARRAANLALVVVGVVAFVYGGNVLLVFIIN